MVSLPVSADQMRRIRRLAAAPGGYFDVERARSAGVGDATIRALLRQDVLERCGRGFYRHRASATPEHLDLVVPSIRWPGSVVCLVSALSFHDLTTQIPHWVWLMAVVGARPADLTFPPVRFVRRPPPRLADVGVERHRLDGVQVRITSPERTLVDCLRMDDVVSMDVTEEALGEYLSRSAGDAALLRRIARLADVEHRLSSALDAVEARRSHG